MKHKLIQIILAVIVLASGAWLLAHYISGRHGQPAPPVAHDSVAPVIQLNIPPQQNTTLTTADSLQVAIKSNSTDIARVTYHIDSTVIAQSFTPPFAVTISLHGLAGGVHTLQAYAYDHAGNLGKTESFKFTVNAAGEMQPADKSAQAIVHQGLSIPALANANKPAPIIAAAAQTHNSGGNEDAGNNTSDSHHNDSDNGDGDNSGNGGDDNGDNTTPPPPPPPTDTTPWPDAAPAAICGNSGLLDGPASAPAGAVTVPAGDNSGVNFTLANTTYWFAPGTHTIGTGQFSQISPGNNARFTGGPGAVLDGQHLNQYAFTQTSTGVTIEHLTIQNFVAPRDEGVINHDSATGWTIQYITAQNNGGGAVFVGSDGVLRYSCLKDNGQYGFQVYSPGGPTNVLLDHNEISGNNTDDWETQVNGCGCTGGGKFWDATSVDVTNNYVHDNKSVGLWADTNDNDFLVEGNYIADNEGQGLFYEISYNMIVRNNNFLRNAQVNGILNGGFPTGAIYLSEAGGDNRVPARTANIDIYDNNFGDNWSGVVLWENADRYCASPNNTSGGYCTEVNPAATLASCSDPATGGQIDQEPYTSDCRWKTQNVKVHDNTFALDKSAIPQCATTPSCGLQGIFSNSGSSPSWSPYMGDTVINDITFNQNNLFSSNTYTGDWNFMVKNQNKIINYAIWQSAPYNQDAGSTLNGQSQLLIENALDADTSTMENGLGEWTDWFNTTDTQSSAEAHSGTKSMKTAIGDQFWGVQFSTFAGAQISSADKTISFWAKQTAGGSAHAKLTILWLDDDQNSLRSDTLTSPALNNTWQETAADYTPPAGATSVSLTLAGNDASNGAILYFDDFKVADKP